VATVVAGDLLWLNSGRILPVLGRWPFIGE